MLFNSSAFLAFFGAFLLCYFLVRSNLTTRNLLVVAASYFFYGWWDYRFLILLLASSLLDFFLGLAIERSSQAHRRKGLVALSVAANLSILGFFKYYGFFVESLEALLRNLGWTTEFTVLKIVLPVGISFYTFQSLSYTIDVYRGTTRATRNLPAFLAYVAFFPQLVAGPIERARHLLPQFQKTIRITPGMIEEGIWLTVWGMFKKVVLADNLAPLVEMVFDVPEIAGPVVLMATVAFGFQIYCDFSGYSDIARGTARLLGFDLMLNFDLPYSAANPREFWRRWHISLSTWLRDYLYFSLGGNQQGRLRTHANLMVTMLLGGLWHGAAWNFIVWGGWHGAALSVHRLMSDRRRNRDSSAHRMPAALHRGMAWFGTMCVVFYGWLLFRSNSLEQIFALTGNAFALDLPPWSGTYLLSLIVFTLPVLLMQFWQRRANDLLAPLALGWIGKGLLQAALIIAILLYWNRQAASFIYFQF